MKDSPIHVERNKHHPD